MLKVNDVLTAGAVRTTVVSQVCKGTGEPEEPQSQEQTSRPADPVESALKKKNPWEDVDGHA